MEEKDLNVTEEIDYIGQIEELKKNSVSREQYNKSLEENRKLLNALVNGEQINTSSIQEKRSVDEIRKDLFDNKNHTNYSYVGTMLELRNRILEEGGTDPFLPSGRKITPTREDEAAAERVAEGLQHCYDIADGDPDVFTAELQRITKDNVILPKKRK